MRSRVERFPLTLTNSSGRTSVSISMLRLATLLLLALSLFLGPALCGGGLLDHACECGEDVSCGHEDDCAADPFQIGIPAGQHELLPDAGAAAVCALNLPRWEDPWIADGLSRRVQVWPPPPRRSSLPYQASDRPLRL